MVISLVRKVLACMAVLCFVIFASCSEQKVGVPALGRVDIYHVASWRMTTSLPLDCQKLVSGEFPAEIVSVTDSSELNHWNQLIDTLRLSPWQGDFGGDCRICCMLYNEQNRLVRAISLWPTGLTINDSMYEWNDALVPMIRPHLPVGYLPDSTRAGDVREALES